MVVKQNGRPMVSQRIMGKDDVPTRQCRNLDRKKRIDEISGSGIYRGFRVWILSLKKMGEDLPWTTRKTVATKSCQLENTIIKCQCNFEIVLLVDIQVFSNDEAAATDRFGRYFHDSGVAHFKRHWFHVSWFPNMMTLLKRTEAQLSREVWKRAWHKWMSQCLVLLRKTQLGSLFLHQVTRNDIDYNEISWDSGL